MDDTGKYSAGGGAGTAKEHPEHTPTEDQVDMKDTVPQRINKQGQKLEDMAGTGQHDSKGG